MDVAHVVNVARGLPFPGGAPFGGTEDVDCLIFSLDFGSTFSGIAYAFTSEPSQIYSIDVWPGDRGRKSSKVPTAIQYGSQSKDDFKWGYEVDLTIQNNAVELKTLLHPVGPRVDTKGLPKAPEEIVADYIRAVFQYASKMAKSKPQYNKNITEKYVLTIPPTWTDQAKARMKRVVRRAGISPVDMVIEPEAAALYALRTVKDIRLKGGDAVVVCDVGGSNIETITYDIVSIDPFELKALTATTSSHYGSSGINRAFEEYIESTVGHDGFSELKKTAGYHRALVDFDISYKPTTKIWGDPEKSFFFVGANLRVNEASGVHKDSITVSELAMYNIFNPTVQGIAYSIRTEITRAQGQGATVKAVFLVGGFGGSPLLKSGIEAVNRGIRVIQPNDSLSAISKGGAMTKLSSTPQQPRVISTRASKHYGTKCHSRWELFRDRRQPKKQYKFWAGDRCDMVQWHIYQGDELVRGRKNGFELIQRFPGHSIEPRDLIITQELVESVSELEPIHPNEHTAFNCELKTDLSKVPKEYFQRKTLNGELYSQITYNLLVENLPSDMMKFSIEINGVEYSAVEARY